METPTSHLESHTQKHHLKCLKKRLTLDQVRLLETSFSFNNKLDSDRKFQLAQELGLPPRQVAIWYQNKRARWKNQSLEVDHKALQQKLERALADNARLEKEVEELKEELHKVNEMLSSSINTTSYPSFSSFSSSCDEVGSPNLLHGSQQQLDKELYTYLIDEVGQFGASARHDLLADPSIS